MHTKYIQCLCSSHIMSDIENLFITLNKCVTYELQWKLYNLIIFCFQVCCSMTTRISPSAVSTSRVNCIFEEVDVEPASFALCIEKLQTMFFTKVLHAIWKQRVSSTPMDNNRMYEYPCFCYDCRNRSPDIGSSRIRVRSEEHLPHNDHTPFSGIDIAHRDESSARCNATVVQFPSAFKPIQQLVELYSVECFELFTVFSMAHTYIEQHGSLQGFFVMCNLHLFFCNTLHGIRSCLDDIYNLSFTHSDMMNLSHLLKTEQLSPEHDRNYFQKYVNTIMSAIVKDVVLELDTTAAEWESSRPRACKVVVPTIHDLKQVIVAFQSIVEADKCRETGNLVVHKVVVDCMRDLCMYPKCIINVIIFLLLSGS